MLQPQNAPMKYETLFTRIDTGEMKIPMFQRDFVWNIEKTTDLIDSILKGYPIGTFIFWKTKERIRHIKDIGNVDLPDVPDGDKVFYVLDGQQRITSLYVVRKGITMSRNGQKVDYGQISIDLSKDPDGDEQIAVTEPPDKIPSITVYALLNDPMEYLAKNYLEHLGKLDIYRTRLTGYDFATVVIEEYPIDVACEVFTRINTGGTVLTLFEIMVAKTYSEARDFDLSREFDLLLDGNGDEKSLADAGFDTTARFDSATMCCCTPDKASATSRYPQIGP